MYCVVQSQRVVLLWADTSKVCALQSTRSKLQPSGHQYSLTAVQHFCKAGLNLQSSNWLANPSLPLPGNHLHLLLPPPFTLAPCQLPSASPLWCSERNFTAAVSLLFTHARTSQNTHARAHMHLQFAPTHRYTYGHKSHKRACTQTQECLPEAYDPGHSYAHVGLMTV